MAAYSAYDQRMLFPCVPPEVHSTAHDAPRAAKDRRRASAETESASDSQENQQQTNIYISNLPRTITEAKFKALCVRYGQVFSTKLLQRDAPMPTIGFAQYTTSEMAQKALKEMNGLVFHGRQLKVRMAHRDKDKGIANKPSANLYVSNLPKHFTEEELVDVFSPYGTIISLVVLKHPMTGQSKGIGLVRFSSVGEARRAKESLHGIPLQVNTPMEVKYAENDKDRSLRLARRQHPESEFTLPETPFVCDTVEQPKKTKPPHLSVDPKPSAKETLHEDPKKSLDADAVYAALAAFANLIIPMDASLVPSFDLRPNHDAEEEPLVSEGEDSEDPHVESVSDTCGHSTGSRDSFGMPSPTLLEPSREAQRLRADAPPFVPKGIPTAPSSPAEGSTTIKVEGLPSDTHQVMLYRLCTPYGGIKQVNLRHHEDGHSCTAFIQYGTAADAQKAQAALNGHAFQHRNLVVSL
eukprot:GGOE01029636.1.p1 GENE.GGOE01029636.1~~GGOE01029636.1.p1  ORF type:complete len:540 (+),score=143.91 GGOE01029636.1:224-1621(+)